MQPIASPVNMQSDMSSTALPAEAQPGVPGGMQEVGRSPSEQMAWNKLTPEQQAQVGALPPDAQAQFISTMMSDFGAAAGDAQQDMSRADALRGDVRATGQTVGPGNIYVGANPLEHMADGMRQYQGMKGYKEAKDARGLAREEQKEKLTMLGENMFSRSDALRGMVQ